MERSGRVDGMDVEKRKADKIPGKVWLAGAGPGDASLLTVKTKELMEKVDTIVYDALIGTEILCQLPAEKELIYVGKRTGHHYATQEEINQILLEKAKEGKDVLRLKGGDPLVFGRGGEELEVLVQEGISFEIIPGVTSATAVLAYAGIPITHRDYASSFHVITGHPRKDGTSRVDYPALAKMEGTLVFLMGLSKAEEICQGLIGAGMSADTPAAVLERGTNARQRSVVSNVENLPERIKEENIKSPAILVVGKVCVLASRFGWVKKQILGGRQFVVTRPKEQSVDLARRLRGLGAQVLEIPAIRTIPIRPNEPLARRMEQFARQKGEAWLVFTSPAGVRFFFAEMLEQGTDLRSIFERKAKVKLAVIGSATRNALREYGLLADLMPEVYDSESLGILLAKTAAAGSEIVIARAREGSEKLISPLKEAGFKVTDLALYKTKTTCHEKLRESVTAAFAAGEVDGIIFTSASTVRGFAQAFLSGAVAETEGAIPRIAKEVSEENVLEETVSGKNMSETMIGISPKMITAVCIGARTAEEARKYKMKTIVSEEASMDGLVEVLCGRFGNVMEEKEAIWDTIGGMDGEEAAFGSMPDGEEAAWRHIR